MARKINHRSIKLHSINHELTNNVPTKKTRPTAFCHQINSFRNVISINLEPSIRWCRFVWPGSCMMAAMRASVRLSTFHSTSFAFIRVSACRIALINWKTWSMVPSKCFRRVRAFNSSSGSELIDLCGAGDGGADYKSKDEKCIYS